MGISGCTEKCPYPFDLYFVIICLYLPQVGTRLRNRIAEQLLTTLEPDHHETIMQLQAAKEAAAQQSKLKL